LTKEKDAQYLYTVVANIYGAVVQYAIPGSIEAECDLLINGGGTPLENLANVIRLTFTGCFEISYQGYVDYYKNITEPFEGNICKFFKYLILKISLKVVFFRSSKNLPVLHRNGMVFYSLRSITFWSNYSTQLLR